MLVAIGLAVAAVVTYEEQRSFLLRRVDQQVAASELPVSASLGLIRPRGFGARTSPLGPVPRLNPLVRPANLQPSGTYGELLSASRSVISIRSFAYGAAAASPPALGRRLPLSIIGRALRLFTVDSKAGSGLRYRVAAVSVNGGRVMVIAVPLREADQTLARLILVEGVVGASVIAALVALGWIVIRVSMRPLERIGRVASEIAHGDLSRRVRPSGSRTEIGRLGLALNEMLTQIERAFSAREQSEDRLRDFLADASHELRTPLAAIRGYAEVFRLGAARGPGELKRAMARIEAEAARMGALVEDLLTLASLDELPEVRRAWVELRELAEHAAADARAIASDRRVGVTGANAIWVRANPDQLRQVLGNLIRNAIIHTQAGSPIDLTVGRREGTAVLTVRDFGPGLPAGAGEQMFERFWRKEAGRSRGRGGAGLGLSIVSAIVAAHGGTVRACDADGGGAEFQVSLPLFPAPAQEIITQNQAEWCTNSS